MQLVKEYYENYQIAPSFDALDQLTELKLLQKWQKNMFLIC